MITMADEEFEHLFRDWETRGYDPSLMRETHEAIVAMEVGDNTPLPGTLRLEPALIIPAPPMHQGWNDTAEGPFLLPASATPRKPAKRITLRGLNTELRHLRQFVAVFAFVVLFVLACMLLNWSNDWP